MSKPELLLAVVMFVIFGLSVTRYTMFARKHYSAYLPPGHLVKRHIFGSSIIYSGLFCLIYTAIFLENKSVSKIILFILIVNSICLLHFLSIQNMIYAYVFGGRAVIELASRMTARKDQGESDIEETNSP